MRFGLAVLCFRRSSPRVSGSPGSAPRDVGVSGSLGGGWLRGAREGMGESCVVVVMGAQSRWGPSERRPAAPLSTVPPKGRKPATPSLISRGGPCLFIPGLLQLLEKGARPEVPEVASGVRRCLLGIDRATEKGAEASAPLPRLVSHRRRWPRGLCSRCSRRRPVFLSPALLPRAPACAFDLSLTPLAWLC